MKKIKVLSFIISLLAVMMLTSVCFASTPDTSKVPIMLEAPTGMPADSIRLDINTIPHIKKAPKVDAEGNKITYEAYIDKSKVGKTVVTLEDRTVEYDHSESIQTSKSIDSGNFIQYNRISYDVYNVDGSDLYPYVAQTQVQLWFWRANTNYDATYLWYETQMQGLCAYHAASTIYQDDNLPAAPNTIGWRDYNNSYVAFWPYGDWNNWEPVWCESYGNTVTHCRAIKNGSTLNSNFYLQNNFPN